MLRRLPLVLGALAALAAVLLLGPVVVAAVVLRASSDAIGPGLAAQLLIAAIVLALAAIAFLLVAGLTRRLLRGRL